MRQKKNFVRKVGQILYFVWRVAFAHCTCMHAAYIWLQRCGNCCEYTWNVLSNLNFLHLSQILHCLKSIDKYRNVHAHLFELCSHACRRAKIFVSNNEPSWTTCIFFIICKCMHIYPHCPRIHARNTPKFFFLHPWHLLDNHSKFHDNPPHLAKI